MEKERFECKIELGALTDAPVYCSHRRGKNWMAVISKDPKGPGGLRRRFLANARGQYYYMVEGLKVGDPVEFGADYYTSSGHRDPERWYGVVIELTADHIVIERYSTAVQAIEAAQALAGPTRRELLELEKATLLARLAEIEAELAELARGEEEKEEAQS